MWGEGDAAGDGRGVDEDELGDGAVDLGSLAEAAARWSRRSASDERTRRRRRQRCGSRKRLRRPPQRPRPRRVLRGCGRPPAPAPNKGPELRSAEARSGTGKRIGRASCTPRCRARSRPASAGDRLRRAVVGAALPLAARAAAYCRLRLTRRSRRGENSYSCTASVAAGAWRRCSPAPRLQDAWRGLRGDSAATARNAIRARARRHSDPGGEARRPRSADAARADQRPGGAAKGVGGYRAAGGVARVHGAPARARRDRVLLRWCCRCATATSGGSMPWTSIRPSCSTSRASP